MASASYITGSHAFKARHDDELGQELAHVLVERADQHAGVQRRPPRRSRRAPPTRCRASRCPVRSPSSSPTVRRRSSRRSTSDLGFFVQDTWTMNKLTLNLGAPLRRVQRRGAGGVRQPAGNWIQARNFAAIPNVPNWNDWSVRFAGAYDLFGNGKTAIKANASKYIASAAAGYAQNFNPMNYSHADARLGRLRRQQVDPRRGRQHPVQRSASAARRTSARSPTVPIPICSAATTGNTARRCSTS